MRIARVIGQITLSQPHAALTGGRFLLAVPYSLEMLGSGAGRGVPGSKCLVVYDELGAGLGSLVGVSEGREAAVPFAPQLKPVDALVAAILDHVQVWPAPAVTAECNGAGP
jgi:microcompartment protein CcmK/EutM